MVGIYRSRSNQENQKSPRVECGIDVINGNEGTKTHGQIARFEAISAFSG